MINLLRINSILSTPQISEEFTGVVTFDLASLQLDAPPHCILPSNIRLGHLAERVVSEAIKSSVNYETLHENVQIKDNNQTIGELDFIIRNLQNQSIVHVEIAYKFYLLDPSLPAENMNQWIGPNRRDSLAEKLNKLKTKQFPLLHHSLTKQALKPLHSGDITQALCLLACLYVPLGYVYELTSELNKAVRGYYVNKQAFTQRHQVDYHYYIPTKKEWGMNPTQHTTWYDYDHIKNELGTHLSEQRAPLIWQKNGSYFCEYFVIWW